jgi:hypothetical protein
VSDEHAPRRPRVLNQRLEKFTPNQPPPTAVYIGRATRNGWKKSKWRNPFQVGRDGTRNEVIAKHAAYLCDDPVLMAALPELRGKDLLCWCAPEACHGDLLLRLANA